MLLTDLSRTVQHQLQSLSSDFSVVIKEPVGGCSLLPLLPPMSFMRSMHSTAGYWHHGPSSVQFPAMATMAAHYDNSLLSRCSQRKPQLLQWGMRKAGTTASMTPLRLSARAYRRASSSVTAGSMTSFSMRTPGALSRTPWLTTLIGAAGKAWHSIAMDVFLQHAISVMAAFAPTLQDTCSCPDCQQ